MVCVVRAAAIRTATGRIDLRLLLIDEFHREAARTSAHHLHAMRHAPVAQGSACRGALLRQAVRCGRSRALAGDMRRRRLAVVELAGKGLRRPSSARIHHACANVIDARFVGVPLAPRVAQE
jgi:hypothetical protein